MAYRVAILGAGIGGDHLKSYMQLRDAFQITWICDQDLARAEALAGQVASCSSTASIEQVLKDDAVDIVDICLPPALHASVSIQALAAGKHVICEKPVACNVAQAEQIAAEATKANCLFVPVFQYRYGNSVAQLEALKQAELLGRAFTGALETYWNRTQQYYGASWRGKVKHELGGSILSHAIHIHDLASQFFGHAVEVSGLIDTRVNKVETEDCAALSMRMQSGALVSSSITLGAADNSTRLHLAFENLSVTSSTRPYDPGCDQWTFTARDPKLQAQIDEVVSQTPASEHQGYAGLFNAVAQKLDGKDAQVPSCEDAVYSLELASAIYLAAEIGQKVSLPLDRDHPICHRLEKS